MQHFLLAFKRFLIDRFSLHADTADAQQIITSISKNVEFKGSNLWALIFAIFIASIGLNVNSTAVIIGAMLISPIMGPIMGIGLGIGINEIDLIKRGAKNLFIAATISISVSALYFMISPLHEAQSELLARTTPTIWDVFIAIFGGLAGIVGGTRREKTNVIPGVAIATALMPPLCTAGYGLSVGNFYYFFGAVYLFFINSIFICLSTYLVVKYMHLPKKAFIDEKTRKRNTTYILIIVVITVLPSIYLAYRIVGKSIFEANANSFIRKECEFTNTQLVNKRFTFENGVKKIDLLFIGEELSDEIIDTMKRKMVSYKLFNTQLIVHQGLNAKKEINFADIKASILEDIFNTQRKKEKSATDSAALAWNKPFPDLRMELNALYPSITGYTLNRAIVRKTDTSKSDSLVLFTAIYTQKIQLRDQDKLRMWLKPRLKADTVSVVLTYERPKKMASRK